MNKSSFFIAGQHAVIEALRNPKRKVLRVFLTEEAKKNIISEIEKKQIGNKNMCWCFLFFFVPPLPSKKTNKTDAKSTTMCFNKIIN